MSGRGGADNLERDMRQAIAHLNSLADTYAAGAKTFTTYVTIATRMREELTGGRSEAVAKVATSLQNLTATMHAAHSMMEESGKEAMAGAEALVEIIPHVAPPLLGEEAQAANAVAESTSRVLDALSAWNEALPHLRGYSTEVDEAVAAFARAVQGASEFYASIRARALAIAASTSGQ
ncbi:MAG: hypothetical protein ACJ768_19790 [Gaiellaceae bacterium]